MNIQINQLGYTPDMTKTAVLRGKLGSEMSVLNAAGEAVLTLPVCADRVNIWDDDVAVVDFSALKAEGLYTLRCGEESSYPFPVSNKPYDACLNALVDMFYYQRCGGEVDERAGVHAHPACHDSIARVYGTDEFVEASGGWHDAGDYGRYIVPAAKTVADMLLAYEWNKDAFVPGKIETSEYKTYVKSNEFGEDKYAISVATETPERVRFYQNLDYLN